MVPWNTRAATGPTISLVTFSHVLGADLQEFGRSSLLHWIEALSLLGALDKLTARIQTRATGSDDSGYTN